MRSPARWLVRSWNWMFAHAVSEGPELLRLHLSRAHRVRAPRQLHRTRRSAPARVEDLSVENIAEAQADFMGNGSRANCSSSRRSLNEFSGFKLSASAGTWIEHVVTC